MGEVKGFYYEGTLSASKSLMNRALIVSSFFPELKIDGESKSQDVVRLKNSLADLAKGKTEFVVGEGGTTFRFLVSRLSREPGTFIIEASERLLERPHQDLFSALKILGTQIEKVSSTKIKLDSTGWRVPVKLPLSCEKSSQFASSLLLSSWGLDRELNIEWGTQVASQSYLQMTLSMLERFGMTFEFNDKGVVIPSRQTLVAKEFTVEPDMSSAFTLAAFAAFKGELRLQNVQGGSLQPDVAFVDILQTMGAALGFEDQGLTVKSTGTLKPIDQDLSQTPDLFPVLAVLLSRADGVSKLTGLETLVFKESNRLEKTIELLRSLGVQVAGDSREVIIEGKSSREYPSLLAFNPDEDHRMAMAAALAVHQGACIEIQDRYVLNKSFPEFWEIVDL